MTTKIRSATRDDVRNLAAVVLLAARSHVGRGVWDLAIPDSPTADEDRVRCIEAVLQTEKPSWCHYSNFIVAEVDGEFGAALSGYAARDPEHLALEHALIAGFRAIGFGDAEIPKAFEALMVFVECHAEDAQGAWVVEWVATLPGFRRRGLVHELLLAILERGRERGHPGAQIGILIGNVPAQSAYENVGFRVTLEKTSENFEAAIGSPGLARLELEY